MGLIVNKPHPDTTLAHLLEQLDIEAPDISEDEAVYFGGPVETARGFVLYDTGYATEAPTVEVPGGFRMTATLDVLEDIGKGKGPERRQVALGYAGWSPGQLEAEIRLDAWLVADPTQDLVFDAPATSKWSGALKILGIDGLNLSSTTHGHA